MAVAYLSAALAANANGWSGMIQSIHRALTAAERLTKMRYPLLRLMRFCQIYGAQSNVVGTTPRATNFANN